MQERIREIKEEALGAVDKAEAVEAVEQIRVRYLGRKGVVADMLGRMKELSPEERPVVGKNLNMLKQELEEKISEKLKSLSAGSISSSDGIDLTLPSISPKLGRLHPITQIMQQICGIFAEMAFEIVEGPEIETEFNNFEALNIPLEHPSRDAFDTFYIKSGELLLRSHTSPVQIRVMRERQPPLAIVVPGKVYRPDAVDASHSFMFHQIEGLMVGVDVTFANLKAILFLFAKRIFGEKVKMRFRPHFFPFTEPSAEVDISCMMCGGSGCRVCSKKGWLEVLGAGMVDPEVFKAVGYNSEQWTGFAFGMGVERIAMLKYGIDDIRLFFENDMRFLEQF